MRRFGTAIVVWAWIGCLVFARIETRAEVSDRTRLALETLYRLKGPDPELNPALQQTAARIADQLQGEPEWVELVSAFHLKGRESGLIAFAASHPDSPQAADAVRLALNGGLPATFQPWLSSNSPSTVGLLRAMAASTDPKCLPLVRPLVLETNRSLQIRSLAIGVLVSSSEGASHLLTLTRSTSFPQDLRGTAEGLLRSCRWPEIRTALSVKAEGPDRPAPLVLPPLEQLLDLPGDPQRGGGVFRRSDVGCSGCHQVGGDGVDFGPKLTEIGAKLGKEALIASIVDPSGGVSFGYEAWRITRRDGEELLGLVASETEDELLLKQSGGSPVAVRKTDIVSREKQSVSLMPSGLHENLSLEEFTDLIAYLASLKSRGGPSQ
ncbi:MAG: hypothetical protein RIS76_2209 [Verrucomicrobiota bacterium]|jgi:putative heme-binding domain-containing protein